jgi:hypothetical protein
MAWLVIIVLLFAPVLGIILWDVRDKPEPDRAIKETSTPKPATSKAVVLFAAISAIATALQAYWHVVDQRAALSLSPTTFTGGLVAGKEFQLTIDIRNFGKSAAYLAELLAQPQFVFGDNDIPQARPFISKENAQRPSSGAILAGSSTRIVVRISFDKDHPHQLLAQPFIDLLQSGNPRFYYYGSLKFTDEYSWWGEKEVGFCFFYDYATRDEKQFASCPQADYTFTR